MSETSVGICVPTNREDAVREFLESWRPYWSRDAASPILVQVFIHEDRPDQTFRFENHESLVVTHTSQRDISTILGDRGWIIPRESAACRSFPLYLAWRTGCDYIIALDDDCHPESEEGANFLPSHLAAFQRDRWFRTIGGDTPRGIPYQRLGHLPVRLNHGLWSEVPDLDSPTALVRRREPKEVCLPTGHGVIPPGMAYPMCAMNVCYHRSVLPAAYNLLMGLSAVGIDRFDDIWSGLILKRVLDYMGWYATSGEPFVRHTKRSNGFSNLRKEALGLELHEHLWEFILDAPLPPGLNVSGAFEALAHRMREFPIQHPMLPCPDGYFDRLSDAMAAWVGLFERAPD